METMTISDKELEMIHSLVIEKQRQITDLGLSMYIDTSDLSNLRTRLREELKRRNMWEG